MKLLEQNAFDSTFIDWPIGSLLTVIIARKEQKEYAMEKKACTGEEPHITDLMAGTEVMDGETKTEKKMEQEGQIKRIEYSDIMDRGRSAVQSQSNFACH